MPIGSALGGIGLNMAASAFNNKMADKAAEKQYQRQLDFWEKQNQYNDPSAQRSRLERAGYNPAAAAGQVAQNNTAGQLSSVPGNEYAQRGAVDPNALNNSIMAFGKLEQIGANTDLMQRQLELTYLTELVQKSELYGINLTNQEKEKMLGWLDKEKELSLEKMLEEIRTMRTQQDVNNSQVGVNNSQVDVNNSIVDLNSAQATTEWLSQNYKVGLIAAEKEYKEALKQTEDDLRQGKVTSQSLQNALDALDYDLRKLYGDDFMKIELEKMQDTVMENDEFREFRKSILQAQDIEAWAKANLAELIHTDLVNLPPRERYLINLFSNLASHLK